MIRVLMVDDHPIVRQGVRSLLSTCADLALVGEAEDAVQALDLARTTQPDVILLDIRMPGASGVDAVRALFRQAPHAKILILTSFEDDEYISQALQAGVHGYVLKSASDETLAGAVRAVQRGERVLSPAVTGRVVEQFASIQIQKWKFNYSK